MYPIDQLALKIWIEKAGFRHSCFISWPSRSGPKVKKLVAKLKQAIEEEAPTYGLPASVFSDADIPTGTSWEAKMSRALCESIAMIAICGPEYYNSDWCGREWAGMLLLAQRRLGPDECAILPLVEQILRSSSTSGLMQLEILPPPVKKFQCIADLSQIRLRRRNYEESDEFDDIIRRATARICEIALQLAKRGSRAADCGSFVLPVESSFSGFRQAAQRFPFLTEP